MEGTHPVVELGTAIIFGWQVEHGVVVGVPGVQERPDILNVVPESQLHALSRKRHHWQGKERPGSVGVEGILGVGVLQVVFLHRAVLTYDPWGNVGNIQLSLGVTKRQSKGQNLGTSAAH